MTMPGWKYEPRFRLRQLGGTKLKHAVENPYITVNKKTALDIGASTGGFVDYLLQAGATRVYAVDVGTHQLHDRLRRDPRVILLEGIKRPISQARTDRRKD
jgi:predicted rRNA methylase YqxC with S4 and FtsJ domains